MILICGAGIAGLTLANILEQLGEDYLIYEKHPSIRAEGTGIVLHHNALCILEALQLADDLPGVWLSSMQIHSGRSTQTLPFSDNTVPRALAIHREDLMQRLQAQLPAERIQCNAHVGSLQCCGDSVLVRNSHADKNGRMVVVANGASSHLHGTPQFRSSGQWCWRAIVPGSDLNNVGTEQWFGRHRLGVIPTSADQTYVFHVMRDADASDNQIHLEWLQEQQALEQFETLDFQDADWLSHPLDERVIDWGVGNRVAIGDAAHAMTPNMGLGAAIKALYPIVNTATPPNAAAIQLAPLHHRSLSWQKPSPAKRPSPKVRPCVTSQ